MSEFLERAQNYQSRIHDILLHDWDPLGVIGLVDEDQDEYDHYIDEIHGMLIRHEPLERLVNHLCWVETSLMDCYRDRMHSERNAALLIELRKRIEAGV